MTNVKIDERTAIAVVSAAIGAVAGIFATRRYDKVKKAELELATAKVQAEYPPEYWTAKAEEAKAELEIQRITTESSERLTLDERNRVAEKLKAQREFEKSAPPEYWAQKKVEEEERSRRHQMDLDDARRKDQLKIEREAAKRIEDSYRRTPYSFSF